MRIILLNLAFHERINTKCVVTHIFQLFVSVADITIITIIMLLFRFPTIDFMKVKPIFYRPGRVVDLKNEKAPFYAVPHYNL